jgi:hypothetical protein
MSRSTCSKLIKMLVPAVLTLAALPVSAQVVFFTDFDSGAPVQFSGVTNTEGVQGFAGLGPAGNQFGGLFLRNSTSGNPAPASTLTLTGLAAHTGVDVEFLLAIMDSWDGLQAPDIFNVTVDGASVFAKSFAVASGTGNYTPPAGGDIGAGTQQRGFNGSWGDQAYNMYLEPAFHNIAHTSSSLTVSWFASGGGWQGGLDESWGIENVRVTLLGGRTDVPEPSTLAFLGAGGAGFIFMWRRRRA